MPYILIFAVIVAILAVVFALQNNDVVTVSFFFLEYESSLALVIMLTFLAGILLGISVLLPRFFKQKRRLTRQKKQAGALEKKREQPSEPPPTGPDTAEPDTNAPGKALK